MTPSAEPKQTSTDIAAERPPEWFLGGAHLWRRCRSAFLEGARIDREGAQHTNVGAALCVASVIACAIAQRAGDSQAAGMALGFAGFLAVVVGKRLRDRAWPAMSQSLAQAIARGGHPGLKPSATEQEREEAMVLARESRLGSERGSFEELVSGLAEGRCARREIIAPIRWLGGIHFKRLGKPVANARP